MINTRSNEVLTILTWNIRGLYDKIFDPDLQEFFFKYDIILVTETLFRDKRRFTRTIKWTL